MARRATGRWPGPVLAGVAKSGGGTLRWGSVMALWRGPAALGNGGCAKTLCAAAMRHKIAVFGMDAGGAGREALRGGDAAGKRQVSQAPGGA